MKLALPLIPCDLISGPLQHHPMTSQIPLLLVAPSELTGQPCRADPEHCTVALLHRPAASSPITPALCVLSRCIPGSVLLLLLSLSILDLPFQFLLISNHLSLLFVLFLFPSVLTSPAQINLSSQGDHVLHIYLCDSQMLQRQRSNHQPARRRDSIKAKSYIDRNKANG